MYANHENLKHMRRMDLHSGEVVLSTIATLPEDFNIYKYFLAITNLNESADTYGVIYMPTDNVLGMLEQIDVCKP